MGKKANTPESTESSESTTPIPFEDSVPKPSTTDTGSDFTSASTPDPAREELKARRRKLVEELAQVDRLLHPPVVSAAGSTPEPRIGGTFAPPLDDAKLTTYRDLAAQAPLPIKDALLQLCEMVEVFGQTPRSTLRGTPHPSGRGTIVKLEDKEVHRIWDHVPWSGQTYQGIKMPNECDAYAALFEQLHPTNQRDLRNAAFHLLWYAKELSLDREPLTADML